MNIIEWKEKYIARLMEKGGFTNGEAENTYSAVSENDIDFDYCPIMAADDELSYYGD